MPDNYVGPKHNIMYSNGVVVAWLSGNMLVSINVVALHRFRLVFWMGDHLRVDKPSQHVAIHLGELSLPSLCGRQIKYQLA